MDSPFQECAKHNHYMEGLRFSILEKVGNRNKLDDKENKWMLRLNSIIPHGFNRKLNLIKRNYCIIPYNIYYNKIRNNKLF